MPPLPKLPTLKPHSRVPCLYPDLPRPESGQASGPQLQVKLRIKIENPPAPFAFRVCAPTRVGALRLYPVPALIWSGLLSGLSVSNLFSIKN